ncbi:MAG: hypothetical protein JW395_4032 [Nitrospira sp.]|nr:hypothetical protein [Nitrospira sp.]
MNDNTAGEVEHTPSLQDAATPDHVHEGEIDEHQPQGEEGNVSLERYAVGESPGDERRGNNGKHHLVGDVHVERNSGTGRGRSEGDAVQERQVEIADHPSHIARETERITEGKPYNGGPAHRHIGLHHDGQNIFAADQAAIKEGKSGRHKHDQAAAQQHEGGIAGVEVGHDGLPLETHQCAPAGTDLSMLGH